MILIQNYKGNNIIHFGMDIRTDGTGMSKWEDVF